MESIRVLFVGLSPKSKLQELFNKVDESLMEFPNDYAFSDHITLGRVKSLKNKENFIKKIDMKIKPIKFEINSFELMKSELSKEGPRYSIIETYSLE